MAAAGAGGLPPLGPNDLLGVEYAKALAFFGSSMELTAIPRFGADHDGPLSSGCGPMASASALRRLVEKQGWNGAASYLPEQALGLFSQEPLSQPQRLDRALLLKLRQMEPEQFAALPDCTEGLDRRLYRCARQAGSIEELLQAVKTKRYPLSRLRRILAAAAVGMTGEDQRRLPPYLRVLAANSRGLELLAAAKRRPLFPFQSIFPWPSSGGWEGRRNGRRGWKRRLPTFSFALLRKFPLAVLIIPARLL